MVKKTNSSETLEKGLRILDLFCDGKDSGFTLSEISKRIGVNKTSVYRYVVTYCNLGYLKRDEKTKFYKLGTRTIPLAYAFLQKADLVQAVKPLVDEVYHEQGIHIDVGMMQNDVIHLIYRRESKDTKAFASFTTGISGSHCLATGKAVMAFLDADKLTRFLDQTPLVRKTAKTITEKEKLFKELEEIRKTGFSRNYEEFLPGLIAIGAPLFNIQSNEVVGAVSFDASTTQFSMETFEKKYAPLLVELAKKISATVTV